MKGSRSSKRKKVALFDPYLDVLGGGEKHILSILKVFEDENCDITIFWDKNLQDEFKTRFDMSFKYLITFLPNIFKKNTPLFKKFLILKKFDYFFYVTDGSYFFSSAKNNFVFCMVPKKSLYKMNLLSRIKTANYKFIANSKFTGNWIKKWGIDSQVVYPYISQDFINSNIDSFSKEKLILSVGRFFKHLHSKKQEEVVRIFKTLKSRYASFRDFKLVLTGGLRERDQEYFDELKRMTAKDGSILLRQNVPYWELVKLYEKATIFWQFTGFGVNEKKYPELVEHLGITPLEAMASGCITFAYNAGGHKEIIKDNETGFLFYSEGEFLQKTKMLLDKVDLQKKIQDSAKEFVKRNFSYAVFKNNVKRIFNL